MNAQSSITSRALAVATALTILAAYCPRLEAQTAPVGTTTTPRIGLALSGGGARGVAHIGVLKVLDELRVPISCVTGTSMGAIVGATFAAGRSPAEMEKIVLEADWNEVFRDKPPRGEIAVRRKIDDYKTLFAAEFGVKDAARRPRACSLGIDRVVFSSMVTWPSEHHFRSRSCSTWVATDIGLARESCRQRQLGRSDARERRPRACRWSIDGRLLVDLRDRQQPADRPGWLCADVVIAVNISTPPPKRLDHVGGFGRWALVNFLGIEAWTSTEEPRRYDC